MPLGEAEALHQIGVALLALGRTGSARSHLRQSLKISERLRLPLVDEVCALLDR